MSLITNRYEILETIGQGGMGTVYKTLDYLTNQIVALKAVSVDNDDPENNFPSNTDINLHIALTKEFRILSRLRHPNIVSVLDYGFTQKHYPFFTMEYMPHSQTILEAGIGKSTNTIVSLTIQMLQAMAYLHRYQIVHGDLKPENVLVQDEQVKLLDFGLSIIESETQGRLTGTLNYMAPELFLKRQVSVQSDLYALGAIVYQMIVGELPYNPHDLVARTKSTLDLHGIANHPLELVLRILLSLDPQLRYESATDVIVAICHSTGLPMPPETEAIRESFLQTAPFVGREAELQQLVLASEALRQGQGSSWLIGGESGVGKSRLLEELRIRTLVNGALVLRGQGVEGGNLPYQLWREVLRRLVLHIDLTDLEIGVLKEIVPDVERLLRREASGVPKLDGDAKRHRLELTIADIFGRQNQPIVLLLEDLQWVKEGLDILRQLNVRVAKIPLLIVGTYRNDERPDLPQKLTKMNLLTLERFTPKTIAELSKLMLDESGEKPEVLSLLYEETAGNAFFLVEVVRVLAEDAGYLSAIGSKTLPQSIFTGSIQQIIRRRLQQIPDWGQQLLKLVAVAGRELDFELISYSLTDQSDIFPDIEMLDDWLGICADYAVLELNEQNWRFTHDKLRETLLSDLPESQCRTFHHLIATGIE